MSITHSRPVTTVVLFQGEDLDPLAERRAAFQRATLEQLAGQQPRRLGDETEESDAAEKAREHDEYLDGAIERATKVKLAAMARKGTEDRKGFRELIAEHPPRPDRKAPDTTSPDGETIPGEVVESFEQDHRLGFNVDSIGEPLIMGCLKAWDEDVRPTDEAPQFDSDRSRQAFVDDLDDPSFSKLLSAAVQLNQGAGPDPKVRLSSLHDRMSSGILASLSSSD